MKQFSLEVLYTIIGIGAASGIYLADRFLYLIADNGSYLYEYDIQNQKIATTVIFQHSDSGFIPKKKKPDFEAMAYYANKLYIFGSGSTKKRNLMLTIDFHSKEILATADMRPLYGAMQRLSGIESDDFNIEGVVFTGKKWLFFQRGNGPAGHNGIFTVIGNNLHEDANLTYRDYQLPDIDGVAATFTDAVQVGNQVYFLAAAENSASVFYDGEITGSSIGRLNLDTMDIEFIKQISATHKFEGITVASETADTISFVLCEDNDQKMSQSQVYRLTLTF